MTTMTLDQLLGMKAASRIRLEDAIAAIADKLNPSPLLQELRKEFEIVLQIYKAEDDARASAAKETTSPVQATTKPAKPSKKPHWLSKFAK